MDKGKPTSIEKIKSYLNLIWLFVGQIPNIIGEIFKYISVPDSRKPLYYELIFIVIPFAVFYLFFSKKITTILPKIYQPRYPRLYKYRYYVIVIIFLSISFAWFELLYIPKKLLQEKVIVLVANFDGPDSKRYLVTEQLLLKIHEALYQYSDTKIVSLNRSISEQEGSEQARVDGKDYQADLVVWGYYGVTGSNVMVTIHIENLTKITMKQSQLADFYQYQAPLSEIENFQIQQALSDQMTVYTLFMSGLVRYLAQEYNETISRMSEITEIEKWENSFLNSSVLYFYLGNSYLQQNKFKEALDEFNKAFVNDPININILLNRGITYSNLNMFEEAIHDLTWVIELQSNLKAYFERGNIFYRLGQQSRENYFKAIDDYSQIIKLDSQFYYSYLNRGVTYAEVGEYEKALNDFNSVIRINPNDPNIFTNIGIVYFRKQEHRKAIEYHTRAIENNKDFVFAYLNRSRSYVQLGIIDSAIVDCNDALKYDSLSVDAFLNLAFIYNTLGNYQTALINVNRAIYIDNNNPHAYNLRGVIYSHYCFSDTSFCRKAIDDYNHAIELKKDYFDTYANRGNIYYFLGDLVKAIAQYDTTILIISKNIKGSLEKYLSRDAYFNRGLVYLDTREYIKALNDFTVVLDINPKDANAYLKRSDAYIKLGKLTEAEVDLNRVFSLSSDPTMHREARIKLNQLNYQKFKLNR